MHVTVADLTSPIFRRAALWLVGVDLALVAVHVVAFGIVTLTGRETVPAILRIDQDWSLAEMANYAKWLAIAGLLVVIGARARLAVAWVWAVVFLELLVDDAFQLHERVGGALAAGFDLQPVFGLRPQDMGELLYAAMVAGLVLVLMAFAMWQGGGRAVRFSWAYLAVLAALGAVGVGMDTIHQIVVENDTRLFGFGQTDAIFTILEDGGEMVVASLALAMTVPVASRAGSGGGVAGRAALPE